MIGAASAALLALCSALVAGQSHAQTVATPPGASTRDLAPDLLLTGAIHRPGQDLSGIWTYSKDRYRVSQAEMNDTAADPRNLRFRDINVQAEEARNPNTFFEFDMHRAPRVSLPGSWNRRLSELRHYEGLMWYQRTFVNEVPAGRRAFLRFEAVNYKALVYLNGKPAGQHEGGFTPFTFEVTGLLRTGENQITVGVDSVHTRDSIPPQLTDWENYGGITRGIRLVHTAPTFVDDAFVRLNRDGSISADVALNGPAAAHQEVAITLPQAGLRVSARSDAQGRATLRLTPPPGFKRWSPDSPVLHEARITAGDDVWIDRIGFRTIEVRGEDILLNGQPIFLRGICLHEEEFGPSPVRDITPQAARALLSEVKLGLHGNYVRLAHYPHSETTLRLADEMGLLVWSEIPVYWSVAFDSPRALATARRMTAENVLRDRNRAAVVIWSVGNETPVTAKRLAFQKQLVLDTREWDPTRLVSAALWARKEMRDSRLHAQIEDPLAELLDVLAVNTYTGWYGDDTVADIAGTVWHNRHGKPLLLSEFGADAKAGYHEPQRRPKFSEEFQADFIEQTLEMASNIPFLRGISPWLLKDFQSPRREHPVYQEGWNRKGLVSEGGQRKLAFEVLARHYRQRAGEGVDGAETKGTAERPR